MRERTEKITAEIGEKKEQMRLLEQERQKVVQTYGTKKAEALEVLYFFNTFRVSQKS